MLEFGAVFLRTETELILKSRRVVPGRLLESGFRFAFPEWPAAAQDLVARWRGRQVGKDGNETGGIDRRRNLRTEEDKWVKRPRAG